MCITHQIPHYLNDWVCGTHPTFERQPEKFTNHHVNKIKQNRTISSFIILFLNKK
ncbi:hypothetical protein [Alysiella crassa]|uniref:hypothetical protein n=1 Tax=Alysiella crassa TaxID=153491 RepID=UPI001FD60EA8|nr:hypothetical protein [Alysiella crassa]UOP06723.1 hypothetical protein LVJ80_13500 [Alysiella crassa]